MLERVIDSNGMFLRKSILRPDGLLWYPSGTMISGRVISDIEQFYEYVDVEEIQIDFQTAWEDSNTSPIGEVLVVNDSVLKEVEKIYEHGWLSFRHAINTAKIVSLFDQSLVQEALIHDIALIDIQERFVFGEDSPSGKAYDLISNHHKIGSAVARRLGLNERAVMEHEERYDGSGPMRMYGSMISVEAQIIAVADFFDRTGLDRQLCEIVKAIYANSGRRFRPDVVQRFGNDVRILKKGDLIRLSNGEVAEVAEETRVFLAQPMVMVNGSMIDLRYSDLSIKDIVR